MGPAAVQHLCVYVCSFTVVLLWQCFHGSQVDHRRQKSGKRENASADAEKDHLKMWPASKRKKETASRHNWADIYGFSAAEAGRQLVNAAK